MIIALAILLAVWAIAYILIKNHNSRKEVYVEPETADSTQIPVDVERKYGIAVDSFDVEYGTIRKNQIVAELLHGYNVPYSLINQLNLKSEGIFDIKKMKSGSKFAVFLEKDSSQRLRYFVYENSSVEFIIFSFGDSLRITKVDREIRTVNHQVSGTIKTSLWNTMKDNHINSMVAIRLSEIYAWSIDFFGLQKGDAFRVIYDEQFVDTISIGITKIYAAWFSHNGKEYYAIPFMQDSAESYFDENGFSLRKAFLKAPLQFSRISSKFSNSRFHPILKIFRPHHGVDYSAPYGTPVHTIGDGRVVEARYSAEGGYLIRIKHNSIYTTGYMHLCKFGTGTRTGTSVKQGDVIGYVGSTGLATGPHLDFRIWQNGQPINPLTVKAPPVKPIEPQYKAIFDTTKVGLIKRLVKIKL